MNEELYNKLIEKITSCDFYIILDDLIEVVDISINRENYEKLARDIQREKKVLGPYKKCVSKVHLFKLDVKTKILDWVESYDPNIDEVVIPMEYSNEILATLAKISLEKNITVNQVVVELLKQNT
jgi:hypothetical protein